MVQKVQIGKMGQMPVEKLMIAMGLPMIVSMVLQTFYNIVDSAFISNMAEHGEEALNGLSHADADDLYQDRYGPPMHSLLNPWGRETVKKRAEQGEMYSSLH